MLCGTFLTHCQTPLTHGEILLDTDMHKISRALQSCEGVNDALVKEEATTTVSCCAELDSVGEIWPYGQGVDHCFIVRK